MTDTSDAEVERCKTCKEPIEGKGVLLHGRFPLHPDCYREVIES